jgi:hypothetical protein
VGQEAFRNAHYIKLGAGGKYAHSSIENGIMRFGWDSIPLTEVHAGDWKSIRKRLAREHRNKSTVTADTERLRDLVSSTPDDLWVTFHDSHLWWGRVNGKPVQEDSVSKFRTLVQGWRNKDVKGQALTLARVPGVIAQLQGFRGTVCSVREVDALRRLINAETSPAYRKLAASYGHVVEDVQAAIRGLHWKDFEVLVDLVFRQAGWRRRSMLGESMKYVDLELVEPITGEAYQVQVKSKASVSEFQAYAKAFSGQGFRKLYFVVHSPSARLEALDHGFEDVELILPRRLGKLVVDGGLVDWVLEKVC